MLKTLSNQPLFNFRRDRRDRYALNIDFAGRPWLYLLAYHTNMWGLFLKWEWDADGDYDHYLGLQLCICGYTLHANLCTPWAKSIAERLPHRGVNGGAKGGIGFFWYDSFNFQLAGKAWETASKDPWWVNGTSIAMPWAWYHLDTIVYDVNRNEVHADRYSTRRNLKNSTERLAYSRAESDRRREAKTTYATVYPYRYKLKNGEVQLRTASVVIEKMTWGLRWWRFPVLTRDYIDVTFSDEVGERTGSWKGGTIGCSYNLLPGESAEACFRRMEQDRKFN